MMAVFGSREQDQKAEKEYHYLTTCQRLEAPMPRIFIFISIAATTGTAQTEAPTCVLYFPTQVTCVVINFDIFWKLCELYGAIMYTILGPDLTIE